MQYAKRRSDTTLPGITPKCGCGAMLDYIKPGCTHITVTRGCYGCDTLWTIQLMANHAEKRYDVVKVETKKAAQRGRRIYTKISLTF